jgi:hypothetical protein
VLLKKPALRDKIKASQHWLTQPKTAKKIEDDF